MKYEEIITLINAGYTKEDILAMQTEETQDQTDTEETQEKPVTEDGTTFDSSVIADSLNEIKTTFEEMKKEFIAMNIMNSKIESTEQSADDILAEIINPFNNDNK